MNEHDFKALYCPNCGNFVADVLDGRLHGSLVRLRCPNRRCRRRVWLCGADEAKAIAVDRPPLVVAKSA